MIEKFIPFLIAAGIGLAIGIERERRHSGEKSTMGVRTFVLMALLGALTGYVESVLVAATLALLASALIVAGYLRSTKGSAKRNVDLGLTTEFAAAITFVAGYLAHAEPLLSSLIGLSTLVLLLSRRKLHEFSIEKIKPVEIQAAVILFILALAVYPILPAEPIDPWGILRLDRFVMLLILIGGLQFVGYLTTRILGAHVGFPLVGFISGFVSSTIVFLTMPSRVKENPRMVNSALAAATLATVSTFLLLLIVIGAISLDVLSTIAPSVGSAMLVGLVVSYFFSKQDSGEELDFELKNPLSLISTVKLALLLSGFILAIGMIQRYLGETGTQFASFVAGLVELHGVSIASASMYANEQVPLHLAQTSILLTALASLLSKLVITWVQIRGKYALFTTGIVLLMTAAFLAAWAFV